MEMKKETLAATLMLALPALCQPGCFDKPQSLPASELPDIEWATDTSQTLFGKGPGEPCDLDSDCRIGLQCVENEGGPVAPDAGGGEADAFVPIGKGVCTIVGEGEEGSPCILSADCKGSLVCSVDVEDLDKPKTCMPEGDGVEWDVCTTDGDCKKGFYCQLISFTGTCTPAGEGDVGAKCEDTSDCVAGLYCGIDGRCGIMGVQVPLFTGAACESTAEMGGDARALFEVPRKLKELEDFYRLPFPNDIRIVDGKLNLQGHPTPGPGPVGFDIAARLFSAMSDELSAYGTNPVVYFRFSHKLDLDSIKTADGANVVMVDITDPADGKKYGEKISISWVASTGRGLYICANYLAVYVPWARPLEGNHTYAVILLNTLMSGETEEFGAQLYQSDADFKTVVGEAAPTDSELKEAWKKYTGLRQFLASNKASEIGVSKSSVISAAVFTTYDPVARMAKFKEQIATIAVPEISQMALCEEGTVSPCDDGKVGEEHRWGCFGTSPDYYEIQGIVKVPTFQDGQKPFIDPEDGGAVEWDFLGRPIVKGIEDVCFTLTIPKSAAAPQDGWPVVIYGHGTGGNYRSQVSEGIAKKLSSMNAWNDATKAFDQPIGLATFGWDQVLHGPWRIGPAPLDPESLVFNFRNPKAALGNFYQAASEAMVMTRVLEKWNELAPAIEGLDPKPPLNPLAIQFVGHSQGGISGPLAIPFVEAIDSMVISGTGGGLIASLLGKSAPVNIKDGVIVALQDENVGRTHPVLALLQNYYDPVDPINYAPFIFYKDIVVEGTTVGHKVKTLHTFGLEDAETPPATIKALSQAMRAMLAKAPSMPEDRFEEYSGVQLVDITQPYPVSGGITIEYPTPVEGGHYVIFHNEDAIRHYTNFLATAVLTGKPTIVP
jgi:hypothetical protein